MKRKTLLIAPQFFSQTRVASRHKYKNNKYKLIVPNFGKQKPIFRILPVISKYG